MKKILSVLLSLAVIVLSAPVAVQAASSDEIIDKHGAKTYQGTTSAWGTTWNEDNFTEVTNSNVIASGNLTIKAGEVKDVTVSGSSSKVTISGGTVGDVDCDGSVQLSDGTVGSLEANGDMTLRGGTVKRDARSYQKVTINGKVTVGGSVIGNEVAASGSTGSTVSGSIQADGTITLTGNGLKIKELDGQDTATLNLKSYSGKLPYITDMDSIVVDASSTVTANGSVYAGNLTIAQKGEFVTTSWLELDTLTGPGTLSFNTGKLTIHDGISGKPLLNFNNSARDGQTAFKADRGRVGEDEVVLYDFALERETSDDGDMDEFVLDSNLKEGITLSKSSVALDGKNPVTVVASVKPSFSKFADGTKVVWELHGETSGFTISQSGLSCQVSAKGSSSESYKATLVAYLVDQRGDRLADYRSDSCILTYGTQSSQPSDSGLTLDTYAVTIGAGDTYWVLAVTDSKTPPVAMSYNSSVAKVGAAAAYNKNGKTGWVYPVTGVAKGGVTIDIGGQKMITSIAAGSIVVDTSSYTLNPGGKYYIGVKIGGIDRKNLNVHSQNACTSVDYAGKNKSGLDLYVVTGRQTGVGAVIFEIVGGQSVQAQITVENGAKPHGVSARLIAAA
ncbi:MAG: hypothetical protein ACQGTM_00980 [bacterium]